MMMENGNRRIIIIALISVLVLFSIVSAIPFNTVSYETVETYYEPGVKQEQYTTKESFIVQELVDKQETLINDSPYTVPYGITVPVLITKSDALLIGHFELPGSGGIRIQTASNKILYEQLGQQGNFQVPLSVGEYTVVLRDSRIWGKPAILSLIVKWTELGPVTKYRDVTKNREVPVQVEKQRTITKSKKASFWEMIFGITH
jgi:hypothetical protein